MRIPVNVFLTVIFDVLVIEETESTSAASGL
jgi:hypothetical protein